MEDHEYIKLKNKVQHILSEGLNGFIEDHRDDDKCLYELKRYIFDAEMNGCSWDAEKAQIVLAVLQLKNQSDIQEMQSYLEHSKCGWQGHTYQLYNRCLRFDQRCRRNYHIGNTPEETEKAFADIDEIFLHEEWGALTTYLFGYSLAAMFSSRLKSQCRSIPYFLQIACKQNSNTYRLVHEIIHICDVNTGLFKSCSGSGYRECNHDHMTIYPSESGEKALDSLLYYQDIPIIVDGYENEKLYEALIRETANIPSKTKRLDLKAKFNVFPIFICPVIKSRFQDIFSMDLTNLDILDEYIELILENKQRLGSWAFELVMGAKTYFDERNSTAYASNPEIAQIIQSRKPEDEIPLFYDIDDYRNRLRTNYNRETKLTSKDVTNIGYLMYFFSYYMKVFRHSIRLTEGTDFTYRTGYCKHDPDRLIEQIKEQAADSLFRLHNTYSPTMPETINIDTDSSDKDESKRIRRKGAAYARDIEKYYQSYGVAINILPDAEYKDERYVFQVRLLPGTDRKLISKYADEVRRLLGIEFFFPDITSSSIRLVASEKPLAENSLIKILESRKFRESEMDIAYAVGYDVMGEMVIADVTEFPHLLIGGTSGSGKSSAIHSLLMSIVYKQPADKVKLLLMDFGASRLNMFKEVPHMLIPGKIVNDIREGHQFILKLQEVVEQRKQILDSLDVRAYDKQLKRWPSIVCVIDEFPAFIKQLEGKGKKNPKAIIEDVLARARKVKVHLILAAQDTTQGGMGITNTNLAAGIAFRCKNWHTSKAIIGESDATELSGKGSMYFKCDQGLRRLQGAYMSPEDIMDKLDELEFEKVCSKMQYDEVDFKADLSQEPNSHETRIDTAEDIDAKILVEIIEWIQGEAKEKISNKQLKDNFEMGYDRANVFLELLEEAGIISEQRKGAKLPRMVNMDKAKEFLKDHGYVEDVSKGKWVKSIESSGVQSDVELEQNRDMKPNKEMNIKDRANDATQAVPNPKKKRRPKIDMNLKAIRQLKHNNIKKGPAH